MGTHAVYAFANQSMYIALLLTFKNSWLFNCMHTYPMYALTHHTSKGYG